MQTELGAVFIIQQNHKIEKGGCATKKLETGRKIVDERIYIPHRSGQEMEHS